MTSQRRWCVQSLDRTASGTPTGQTRWCLMARRVYGKRPEYRDSELTACCGMVVTLPSGYDYRIPNCDQRAPA